MAGSGQASAAEVVWGAISGGVPSEARLGEYAERYPARAATRPVEEPVVRLDLEASDGSTVLEVDAADQPGLLAQLARVFADHDLDVVRAKVATLGDRVVDIFYVRAVHGDKLVDPHRLRRPPRPALPHRARLLGPASRARRRPMAPTCTLRV